MAAEGTKEVRKNLYERALARYHWVRQRIPFETGNYPYVTARVKARRALLLPKETYDRFLQMDIPEIARFLGEHEYKQEMIALGGQYSGVDLVEMATSRNLERAYNDLYNFADGHLKLMIGRYLDRFDLQNVKTIVRAKVYGATTQDLEEDIIPAGSFSKEFLEELVEAKDLDAVFEALEDTAYANALQILGKEPSQVTNWAAWEDLVSRLYYAELLDLIPTATQPSRLFREFVRREIDILNLKTLLRAWASKAEFEHEIFLDGGFDLTPKQLHEMVKLDKGQLAIRLSEYEDYAEIATNLDQVASTGVGVLMRSVERVHLAAAERFSHLHPLSVLPVLDYIVRKDREVQNIRIIARGKESRLPAETMRGLLVI